MFRGSEAFGALTLAVVLLLGACGGPEVPAVAPEALAARLGAGEALLVLDVRTPEEFAAGHVPGAVNIPHTELGGRLAELERYRSQEIVVHCQGGGRAALAEQLLRRAGFRDVRDLDGHMRGWQEKGLPVER